MVEIIAELAVSQPSSLASSAAGPRAVFEQAYQRAVDRWPVPVTALDVPTDYGRTHLLASGGQDAPGVLLLPGGGATATAWAAVAGGLAATHRLVAVDPVGQAGLSRPGPRPLATTADLGGWLDQVLDGLGMPRAALAGHSYGAWIALRYALHAPGRVTRLALLDPADCFAPLSLRYRLHAIPLIARPSPARARRLLAWETRGRALNPDWLAVTTAGAALGRPAIVMPRPPAPAELAGLRRPVLVMLAGRSRAHDPARVAARARALLPDVTVRVLAGAAHHSIPTQDAAELAGDMAGFLGPAVAAHEPPPPPGPGAARG
jgi:pimeloyl-ACP methyl ester carboxylesterase